MRRDTPPQRNAVADFVSVRSSKSGSKARVLRRIQPRIEQLYALYAAQSGALETLTARKWQPSIADALRHCYTGSTLAWVALAQALKDAVTPRPFLCPYCLLRHPKTRDHFLPKDQFPEYSILLSNLVLICFSCNLTKGNGLVSVPRQVLNPYFDAIPVNHPLLFADVQVAGGTQISIDFYIDANAPGVTPDVALLAVRHFEAFGLRDDYILESGAFISGLLNELAAVNDAPLTAATLQRALEGRMQFYDDYPINCWQLATLSALDECPTFLDLVNHRIAGAARAEPAQRRRPRREGLQQALALTAGGAG